MTREELLEEYRYVNVDHTSWWEFIYKDMRERLEAAGFHIDNFYWTGFWSQGDGACFEGHVWSSKKFYDAHFTPEQFPWVHQLIDMNGTTDIRAEHRGPYYHAHSVSINVDIEPFEQVCRTDELEQAAAVVWDAKLEEEFPRFEEAVTEVLRGYMQELYKLLNDEYDYLTSDEAVGEYIEDLIEDAA